MLLHRVHPSARAQRRPSDRQLRQRRRKRPQHHRRPPLADRRARCNGQPAGSFGLVF